MTAVEAFDLCAALWGGRAAVWDRGDVKIVGRWVARTEVVRTVLATRTKAVEIIGKGATWEEALRNAEIGT